MRSSKKQRAEKTDPEVLRTRGLLEEVLRSRDTSWWWDHTASCLYRYREPKINFLDAVERVELYSFQNNLLEAAKKAARREYMRLLGISHEIVETIYPNS